MGRRVAVVAGRRSIIPLFSQITRRVGGVFLLVMGGLTTVVGITLATPGSANALVADAPIVGIASTANGGGYWMVASDGGVFAFGDAPFEGSMGGTRLNQPVVGMAADTQTGGYWLVARDGGIFAFNAPFYGSMGGVSLAAPVVGMTSTPDGNGYWLVAKDGGVFAFGDAPFYGSVGGAANASIVGMAVDSRTGGYRLATADGGFWWFNSSSDGWVTSPLNAPVVGIATDSATDGYWMDASDGGVFAFNAAFLGSMGGTRLNKPIVGMAGTPDGNGYWLVAKDGGVFAFGNAPFLGSVPGIAPPLGTTFSDGTFLVGRDIAPGRYITSGGAFCYWARLRGLSGSLADIIANDISQGQSIVTISPNDVAITSNGCGTWVLAPTNGPQATSFGDGTFAVGVDIAPGTYITSGGPECYWARLSGFGGSLEEIITNDLPQGQAVVSIAPTDVGFTSDRCGTWTRQ